MQTPNLSKLSSFEVTHYQTGDPITVSPLDETFGITDQDIQRIVSLCNQKPIYNFLFAKRLKGEPYMEKSATGFIKWARTGWETGKYFVFLARNNKNEIIGAIDIKSNALDGAEVGYWMDENSPGYMTGIVSGLLNRAKEVGFTRLTAFTVCDNEKSQRVLLRAGFIPIGKEPDEEGVVHDKFEILLTRENTVKEKTVDYYNKHAASWVTTYGPAKEDSWWKDEIQKFHKFLPSGSVIEIGSGAGKEARELLDLGYRYLGTDASSSLLELAGKGNPGATFIQKYVHELDSSLGIFDGFFACAVLLHIPRSEIEESLLRIRSLIRPGGIGLITLKEGEGEKIDDKGRLYSYYSDAEFRTILDNTGFSVLDFERKVAPPNTWLIFYVAVK